MIKPYSENRLRWMVFFANIYLSRPTIKQAVADYKKKVSDEEKSFEEKLNHINGLDEKEVKRLKRYYKNAIIFRSNKSLRKEIAGSATFLPGLVLLFILPILYPLFFTKQAITVGDYILIYFGANLLSIIILLISFGVFDFIKSVEIKIGKTISFLVKSIFILSICSMFFLKLEQLHIILNWIVLCTIYQAYLFIFLSTLDFIFIQIVDFRFYSKKLQLTEALIIESAFRLLNTNWFNSIRLNTKRQETLSELERLAGLIENDWSSHIKTGDEKTTKWKNDTFKGIAEGIRSLKKQIIRPDDQTSFELKSAFEGIFEKIVKYDIKGLVGAEVPAVRVHKQSKLKAFKSVLVAILPLLLAITLKLFKIEGIPENYIHIAISISGLWLIISVLLWLDPNLADKIATIKSARGLLKSKQEED